MFEERVNIYNILFS